MTDREREIQARCEAATPLRDEETIHIYENCRMAGSFTEAAVCAAYVAGLTALHETAHLRAELEAAQRRAEAAERDLNAAGPCFTCRHFGRNGGNCHGAGKCRVSGIEVVPCNQPGTYRVIVPDDGRDTYEWRGPDAPSKEVQP